MVSIIIPIYNAARWLHRSVESVLRQDYSDWELILVDDGSSDESLQKCEAYSSINNRIKVLHQENQGVTAARYTGFLQAKGEFVYFLDSDDSLIQNALSPAKIVAVFADPDEKTAKVVVPDYQLSLAIGKAGQNARLAAKLTNWKIDIKSETQANEEGFGETDSADLDDDILGDIESDMGEEAKE